MLPWRLLLKGAICGCIWCVSGFRNTFLTHDKLLKLLICGDATSLDAGWMSCCIAVIPVTRTNAHCGKYKTLFRNIHPDQALFLAIHEKSRMPD
jgi:hypothetical protein